MSANVILLRAPSEHPDRYETCFVDAGFNVQSIPVLETVHTNLDSLKSIVQSGPENLDGVIVTSARACESWRMVIDGLNEEGGVNWHSTPFYVVGTATASALSVLPDSPYKPHDIRGEYTGSSEQLAHFIIQDRSSSSPGRMLYLTGDKNRDTLPKILDSAGVSLHSIQVYQTQGSSKFPEDLDRQLTQFPQSDKWWTVFFAPSAAEFVIPYLRERFHFGSGDNESGRPKSRIASIGPTTTLHLENQLKLPVDVSSPKPKPEALVEAIVGVK